MEKSYDNDTNRLDEDNSNSLNTKVMMEYFIEGSLKNRVCRYCLSESDHLVDVCEKRNIQVLHNEQGVTIKEIIRMIYPGKMSSHKDLPEKICIKCIQKAISSYLFIQQCHMSEKSLASCVDKLFKNVTSLDVNHAKNTKEYMRPNIVNHEKVNNYASLIPNTNENELHSMGESTDRRTTFVCSMCKLDFNCVKTFLDHQKSHKSSDKHICRICDTELTVHKLYLTHIQNVHKIQNANCDNTKGLKSLMDGNFQCDSCNEIFSSWYDLNKHRDKHKLKSIMDCIIDGTLSENICRICLEESNEVISIFQTVRLFGTHWMINGTYILSDVLSKTLPLKVPQPDGMPSQICETCIQSAISSYILDKQYRFSQSLLNTCIEDVQIYDRDNNGVGYSANRDIRDIYFSVHLDRIYENMQISLRNTENIKMEHVESLNTINSNAPFDFAVEGNDSMSVVPLQDNLEAEQSISNYIEVKVESLDCEILSDHQDLSVPEQEIIESTELEKNYIRMHPCTMCIKNFVSLQELLQHLKCHPHGTSHLCLDCEMEFTQISALHSHASETHGKESYLYSLEKQSERQPIPIIEEVFIKRSPSSNNSDVGQFDLTNENHIYNQVKLDIDQETFECTMCARDFSCESELDSHYETHPPGSLLICRICNKKFAQLHFLMKHKLTHGNMFHKTTQCRYCEKNIMLASYANHLLTHSDVLMKMEEEENERKGRMKEHKIKNKSKELKRERQREFEKESTPPETRYKCDKCPHVTARKQNLMVHINRVHLHVQPYPCHICHKRFHGESLLKEHIRIHSNTKPEICEICGHRFVNKNSLMFHRRLHTNERPHKCNECSMGFICATRLRNHVRKIHKPWEFACQFCGRKFYERSKMKTHINAVHLNIKRKRKN